MTPRLAYSPTEAAQTLGISRSTFDRQVLPHLRVTRLAGRLLIPEHELRKWLDDNSSSIHDDPELLRRLHP